MNVNVVLKSAIASTSSGANFFSLARANWGFPSNLSYTADGLNVTNYVTEAAEGQTIFTAANTVAGNSIPVLQRAPSYFPVATRSSECAAITTGLTWADANLLKGYEFCALDPASGGKQTFFVSGILNSSQTLANDPFDNSPGKGGVGMVQAACWSDSYASGMNPFA